MNLPDIMRLDSKAVSEAFEEALKELECTEQTEERIESTRYVGIQFGLSEKFMLTMQSASKAFEHCAGDQMIMQSQVMRSLMLAFLAGWLAHARLEQPKWAENIAGRPN